MAVQTGVAAKVRVAVKVSNVTATYKIDFRFMYFPRLMRAKKAETPLDFKSQDDFASESVSALAPVTGSEVRSRAMARIVVRARFRLTGVSVGFSRSVRAPIRSRTSPDLPTILRLLRPADKAVQPMFAA